MKFSKGLLSEEDKRAVAEESENVVETQPAIIEPIDPAIAPSASQVEIDKNRLFQTVKEESVSGRSYAKLFAVIVLLVLVGGGIAAYMSLPGIGDKVRTPKGGEDAVREYFLTKEKRAATDVVFYQCDGFYWTRVGVETRNDLPNPLFKVGTYRARAVARGDAWDISSALPLTSPDLDVPCK